MNDRQLESFVASFEAGSFRKAALETYLTVPSLVKRVESLETELGYDLFLRTTHGITPTEAGVRFYERARDILRMMSTAKEGPGDASRIACGVWDRAGEFMLEATRCFSDRHPDVTVDFVETDGMTFPEDICCGKIDLNFGNESLRARALGLVFERCSQSFFQCSFAPQSSLGETDVVNAQMIEGYTVYAGTDLRDVPGMPLDVEVLFARDNVVKESIFTEKLIADCLQDKAVTVGFGYSSTLASSLSRLESRPLDWPGAPIGPTFRPDPPALLREFIDLCKKHFFRIPNLPA